MDQMTNTFNSFDELIEDIDGDKENCVIESAVDEVVEKTEKTVESNTSLDENSPLRKKRKLSDDQRSDEKLLDGLKNIKESMASGSFVLKKPAATAASTTTTKRGHNNEQDRKTFSFTNAVNYLKKNHQSVDVSNEEEFFSVFEYAPIEMCYIKNGPPFDRLKHKIADELEGNNTDGYEKNKVVKYFIEAFRPNVSIDEYKKIEKLNKVSAHKKSDIVYVSVQEFINFGLVLPEESLHLKIPLTADFVKINMYNNVF
jgi:hypothetical protein